MSKAEELERLQEAMTEDNAKIMSLAFTLQIMEPSMYEEARDLGTLTRVVYDVAGAIREYSERISSALSDLEFWARDLPEGEAEAG